MGTGRISPQRCRIDATAILLFAFPTLVMSQVIIRERIEIKPRMQLETQQPSLNFNTHTTDPCDLPPETGYTSFFFTMGGRVTVRPLWTQFHNPLSGVRLVAEPSGRVIFDGGEGEGLGIENEVGFVQPGDRLWFTLTFYDFEPEEGPGETRQATIIEASAYYGTMGSKVSSGNFLMRVTPSFFTNFTLSVRLYPDISTAIDLRSETGPPRTECPLVAPIAGDIVMRHIPGGFSGNRLHVQTVSDSMIIDPALVFVNAGRVQAGETMHVSLLSGAPDMFGERVYPRRGFNPWEFPVPFWRLEFEDWIDADFSDYIAELYLVPPVYRIIPDRSSFVLGDTIGFQIEAINNEDPSALLRINVSEGRDGVQLVDMSGTSHGTDIHEIPFSQAQAGLRLVVQGANVERIVLQVFARSNFTRTGRTVLMRGEQEEPLDHFAVTVVPDTIAQTDTAAVFVQAKDANNNEVTIEGNTPLAFTVDKPEYGSIEPASGVTYGVARAAGVRYLANGTNPLTPQRIEITVAGAGKSGSGNVVVRTNPVTLKVSTLQSETTPGGFVNVVVEATRSGQPVSGIAVQLEAKGIEGSGGHDHIGNRPRGEFIVSGGNTSDSGKYATLYIASAFGGKERIIVKSTETTQKDSLELSVRIPNLVPLGSGSNHIITMHTSPDAEQRHAVINTNHGTPNVVERVRTAALNYAQELELTNDTFLAAIDMSLPLGGLFDIGGNWQPPHQWHRLGRSIDFSRFYRNENRETRLVPIVVDGQVVRTTNVINDDKLDFWFDYYGFNRHERNIGKIHYESRN
jgi:hypothetical protein